MAEETQSGPRVSLAFQNYTPSYDAEKAIRRMLQVVPPKYLRGLHSIVLTNVGALSRKQREQKGIGRRREPLGKSHGYYTRAWKGQPAQITLLLDNLEKRWGRSWLRFGILRDMPLAELFYHELGHHIHRLHVPEYDGGENVAEKWSDKLSGKFIRKHYWYLLPLVAPIALIKGLWEDFAKLRRRFRS